MVNPSAQHAFISANESKFSIFNCLIKSFNHFKGFLEDHLDKDHATIYFWLSYFACTDSLGILSLGSGIPETEHWDRGLHPDSLDDKTLCRDHFDGFGQGGRNSSALAMELRLPCINPLLLCMRPASERWRFSVTPSLIGWMHAQDNPRVVSQDLAKFQTCEILSQNFHIPLNTQKPKQNGCYSTDNIFKSIFSN